MIKNVKIICSGEGGVGKTTLLNRYITGEFNPNFKMTKGIEFFNKIVDANGISCNLILWDFAGQKQFREILSDFVIGSIGALLLFDMTRFNTLEKIEEWIKMLNKDATIPIIILGSKYDLILYEDHANLDNHVLQLMERFDNCLAYLKTSSKTGYNVKKSFNLLVKTITGQ
ncbi:MAG: Rab family GTPase [Promethearchaeota archaeon]